VLRRIRSSDDRFKTVEFHRDLNIIVAKKAPEASHQDTRNAVGKSSLIELIHFLLGSSSARTLLTSAALRNHRFTLTMDWPRSGRSLLNVERTGSHPTVVKLRSEGFQILAPKPGQLELDGGEASVSDEHWRQIVERDLFGLPADAESLSGRVLMSFLARRAGSKGFVSPNRTHDRQSDAEGTAHQAYLLGLDWRLAYRYRLIAAQESARRELVKAATDPLWGRVVGRTSELRAKISLAEDRLRQLQAEASDLTVLPNFEAQAAEAATLETEIRQLTNADAVDRRALKEIDLAIADSVEPDNRHLEQVWQELSTLLTEQIQRRFEEVQRFHDSVLRNRRRYLEQERTETGRRMEERAQQRARLGTRHSELLHRLSGALPFQSLMDLQSSISEQRADLIGNQGSPRTPGGRDPA
jgi:uncharacterized protein YydD (DUF2326 family)